MSRELDAQCARALGWCDITDEGWGIAPTTDSATVSLFASPFEPVPRFSERYELARQLEDEIERRGLQWDYVQLLSVQITPDDGDSPGGVVWRAIRATPEQRARAFVEAVL